VARTDDAATVAGVEPAPESAAMETERSAGTGGRGRRWPSLYVQVLIAIALGVLLGWLRPSWGASMRPLGDGFVKLIKMLIAMIPESFVGAFVAGDVLQVLVLAVLTGIAFAGLGERAAPLVKLFEQLATAIFGIVGIVMRLAPLGAFGAMAFTIGKYGIGTLG